MENQEDECNDDNRIRHVRERERERNQRIKYINLLHDNKRADSLPYHSSRVDCIRVS